MDMSPSVFWYLDKRLSRHAASSEPTTYRLSNSHSFHATRTTVVTRRAEPTRRIDTRIPIRLNTGNTPLALLGWPFSDDGDHSASRHDAPCARHITVRSE